MSTEGGRGPLLKGWAWGLFLFLWCLYPSTGVLNIHKAENYHLIFMDVGNAFCWLMTPSPLCLDIYVIKWATPSHHAVFAYCTKTGRWEGLGMKVLLFLQLSAERQPTHTILTDPESFHNNNTVFLHCKNICIAESANLAASQPKQALYSRKYYVIVNKCPWRVVTHWCQA